MGYKIIVDSCCDLTEQMKKWDNLQVIPLTLQIGDYVIEDDKNFNQDDFVNRMINSSVIAKSACPSPQAFASACEGDFDDVYIITITDKLSGCYNSARQGVELYKDEHGDNKNIHIFNSLATAGTETLAAMEIKRLAESGKAFDDIVNAVEELINKKSGIYFSLESFDMLKSNGRLYNLVANVIEVLRVKIIGKAVDGKIAIAGKDLTMKRALTKLAGYIKSDTEGADLSDKKLIISYVCNRERAESVKNLIASGTGFKAENIIILKASGLNSLYASNGGIIVAFNF